MKNQAVIIGAYHEIIELCVLCGVSIVGMIDNERTGDYLGYPILGTDDDAARLRQQLTDVPVILSPDVPAARHRLAEYYGDLGYECRSLISPRAQISPSARLGSGVFVQSGCNLGAGTALGRGVRVNTHANIMHDTVVGEFTTVAPDAVLLGSVNVGAGCYIGANATILPRRRIGDGAVVGAGAVVTKDVDAGITVAGNPARTLKHHD